MTFSFVFISSNSLEDVVLGAGRWDEDCESLDRVGAVRDEAGGCCCSERQPKPQEKSTSDEHGEIHTKGLNQSADDHDETTSRDTPAPSKPIRHPGSDRRGADAPKRHDGADEPELRATWVVEELIKAVNRLQSVHHGTVVAACGIRTNGTREE